MNRPANITAGQPDAQRANVSDESTKFLADVAPSLPAQPSTLTGVESEPLAKEPQPQASTTALSAISLHPMPSPPPPPSFTKRAKNKRKPKTQATSRALGVSVQPFETLEVNSIACASTSALMGFPQMTQFSLDNIMNQSTDNIARYPPPSAQTKAFAVMSDPTDPAFRRTGPTTQTSAAVAASTMDTLSYGAACNDGSPLLLPNTPAPATGILNPSTENMAGLPTRNVQGPSSAARCSELAEIQAFHPPPMTSINAALATTPLQNLVNSLALNYQQDDAIRSQILELDEIITSVLAHLLRLKTQR
ncbi:hypothetical protein MRX96_048985 [Rhipicephalus microplus]